MKITDEEFEEFWKWLKAAEERRDAEWDALSPDERNRRRAMFDDGFAERVSDNPLGGDDDDDEDDAND